MSFFKRLFSGDYRAAVSAEAAGNLELAAERYALAGEHDDAVRVHLARAERAEERSARITALRDALHWAAESGTMRRRVTRELGRALLAKIRAEGIATDRDADRVREAADLLVEAGRYEEAGEALEEIHDYTAAASAYRDGGLVHRMEYALATDESRQRSRRQLRDAFSSYEMQLELGNRDAARDELRRAIDATDKKAEYRRLLDELESRLITGGKVVLKPRGKPGLTLCASSLVALGRDVLGDLQLRAGGVSRRHAEIEVGDAGASPRFHLRDAGSRNGTTIGGMPIAGAVPLEGEGRFALGDHCEIDFRVVASRPQAPPILWLEVASGMDRGERLAAAAEGERIELADPLGLRVGVVFRNGRPILDASSKQVALKLDGRTVAHGAIQLIHGDLLSVDGVEVDVQ